MISSISGPPGGDRQRPKKSGKMRRRRERQSEAALAEERLLAASLFGSAAGAGDDVAAASSSKKKKQKKAKQQQQQRAEPDEFTFEIDRVGDTSNNEEDHAYATEKVMVQQAEEEDAASSSGQEEDDDLQQQHQQPQTAAWVDEDDERVQLNLMGSSTSSRLRKLRTSATDPGDVTGDVLEQRLRQRFRETTQTTARTDWAKVQPETTGRQSNKKKKRATDDDDDWLAGVSNTSAPLLAARPRRLPPHTINLKRCPDANQADPGQAVLQAVHFHPTNSNDNINNSSPLLLTAGLDKSLRFFRVGEERSEKIHGIHFPKLPIYSAAFLGTTGNVVVTGRRSFFYLYDSVAGKLDTVPRIMGREEKSWERCVPSPDGRTLALGGNDGYVILWDAHHKAWKADVKMNGSARAMAFTPDSHELLTSGSDGDVYRWDLRQSHRCVERFSNQDGTITSALAASSRTLAVGAESGVVNVYSEQQPPPHRRGASLLAPPQRDPLKSILNLKTSIDGLRFNGDGQILAMSSRRETRSLKLLHVPTNTVFANWPTSKTPLNYVWSLDFSPGSQFLAVGNDQGKCLLYKLMHYENVLDD